MKKITLIALALTLAISCANKQQMALLRSDAGDRHFEQGSYEEAIAAYEEAIQLDPKSPSPRLSLGKVFAATERYDEASASVRVAVELDPADGEAQALLGQLELSQGRYAESLQALGAAVEAQPDAFRPAFDLALAHLGNEGLITQPLRPGIDSQVVTSLIDWDQLEGRLLSSAADQVVARAVDVAPDRASARALRIVLATKHIREAAAHRRTGNLASAVRGM